MTKLKTLLIVLVITVQAQAQVMSNFNADRDGWTALDHQGGPNPTYQSSNGNPGGFIQVIDGVAGTATYFNAPAKFLGNQLGSLGSFLRFDLQVSVTANSSTAGVRLIGNNLTLVKLLPALPVVAPSWSTYAIKLNTSEGWRVSSTTGPIATDSQIKLVLSDLTGLAINGEYSTAALDGGGLDNVILENVLPELSFYNGISANGDSKNQKFVIENIDVRPDTKENRVTIFNRWGSIVFEIDNYNNDDKVFVGLNKDGKELPTGTYFYRVDFDNFESKTGYLYLKR